MQIWRSSLYLMGLVGLCLISAPDLGAEEPQPSDKGAIVEGAGFTLYDMESIKGSDAERVERDPVCDRSRQMLADKYTPSVDAVVIDTFAFFRRSRPNLAVNWFG